MSAVNYDYYSMEVLLNYNRHRDGKCYLVCREKFYIFPIFSFIGLQYNLYYLDLFVKNGRTEMKKIIPIKEHLARKAAINGKAGTAIMSSALNDERIMKLVTTHYNSITCENEMKPEIILGEKPTYRVDSSGNICLDDSGEPILKLDFSRADKIMDYIKLYNKENPNDIIRVRGHVLVWHSQTPDWFFREKYDCQCPYVTEKKMLKRLQDYIREVIFHYDGENSSYRGIIYAWDVVNEQIEPDDFDPQVNPDSVRFMCNGKNTGWYNVFHGNISYITQAFVFANQYSPKDVKLFYNDYNDADPIKRDAICSLLRKIKETKGARIDGMGMQAHYHMEDPSVELIGEAVRKYSLNVEEVQFTEFDIQSSKNYDGSDKETERIKEGRRYKEIFNRIYSLDQEEGINITGITFWGAHDGVSWLRDFSAVGGGADGRRPQMPLPFDEECSAKPSYWGIIQ